MFPAPPWCPRSRPELSLLKDEVADASTHSVNGVEFSVGTLQYLKLA